jgi:hypothetical protein
MKIFYSTAAAALLATTIVATTAIAAEPPGAASDTVVSVCKRHMIGLGPNYEPGFKICTYLSGAVDNVHNQTDPQHDDQDLATIRAYTQGQLTN